jgi:hypothetical protein
MFPTIRNALSVLLLFPLSAMAATPMPSSLDQILAKHIAARGGMAKIKAIRSLKSSGHITIGPMILDLTIENPRRAFRSDTSIHGMTKTEAFDGARGWIIDPFTKGAVAEAEPMSADQLKQMVLQMDFDGPLVDYRRKGNRIALLGMQQVHGIDAYALKVSLKDGDELTTFIDAKTFMEIEDINNAVAQGKTMEVETSLGDYRPVNGVMLPFSLDIRPKGQAHGLKIILDKVEANASMDRARFKMPERKSSVPVDSAKTP